MTTGLPAKVAIITGAGRGIGRAIALRLAADNIAVIVNDSGVDLDGTHPDPGPAAEVTAEINAAGGGRAVHSAEDISRPTTGDNLVSLALERFGRLDAVICAAGILRDRMIFNMSIDEWESVIDTHLRGTFNLVAPASRYWRSVQNPDANFRIVTVSSVSGLEGGPGQPNYAAAKLGIVGLTYSLARSLAKYGVTANAIAPVAATRMTRSVPGGGSSGTKPSRLNDLDPRYVAQLVGYLVTDRSRWLSGRVISAEGSSWGMYANPQIIAELKISDNMSHDEIADRMEVGFGFATGLAPSRFDSDRTARQR